MSGLNSGSDEWPSDPLGVHPPPLNGIKVVEAASYLSGPYAAMMLADLGADVVKVEHPDGDPFRTFGRPASYVSSVFAATNRGKQSAVLDLKRTNDRDQFLSLIALADVFVCNWRVGVAESLELSDRVLATVNPSLVRCWITGFGPDGPLAAEPAFDSVTQAQSGLADALALDGIPKLLPGYPIDKLTAMMAAQAVVSALLARERAGDRRGDRVDIAMLDVAAYFNLPDLFARRVFLEDSQLSPQNVAAGAVRPLRTADGWLVVAPVAGRQIVAACEALGHGEWAEVVLNQQDPRSMMDGLFDRLESVTVTLSTSDVLLRLRKHDVPSASCVTMDEHLADPQTIHNGIYRIEEWPSGSVRIARYPAVFGLSGQLVATGSAPALAAEKSQDRDR